MKKYRLTIILAVIITILTVKIDKPNMNLKLDQVVSKANNVKIDNLVLSTSDYVAFYDDRGKTKITKFDQRDRFDILKLKDGVPQEYFVSGASGSNEGSGFYHYIYKNGKGYLSKEYGSWQNNDTLYSGGLTYSKGLDSINKIMNTGNVSMSEAEKDYIINYKSSDLQSSMLYLKELGVDKLLSKSKIAEKDIFGNNWDYKEITIRFVVDREFMLLKNVTYRITLFDKTKSMIISSFNNIEQVNIIDSLPIPKKSPALPSFVG